MRDLRRLEQQVVIALAVEWWIEIDQINALIHDILAQNVQAAAEVKGVGGDGFRGMSDLCWVDLERFRPTLSSYNL